MDGDAIAIGEYRNSDAGFVAGAAYAFRRTLSGGWAIEDKILPETQFRQTPFTIYFGTSVSIQGGRSSERCTSDLSQTTIFMTIPGQPTSIA